MSVSVLDTAAAHAAHLDADTLARLRNALVSGRGSQVAIVAEEEARARSLASHRDVDSIFERELAAASAARAREAIGEIDAALARVDARRYGNCESCGAPIPVERLETIPYVRLCVACPRARRSLLGLPRSPSRPIVRREEIR